jgi:hypothetical protein
VRVSIFSHVPTPPSLVIMTSLALLACGAPAAEPTNAKAAQVTAGPDGGAAADGGSRERPFAGSIGEATSLISDVVDKRQHDIFACVRSYRGRKNLHGERLAISFGIDQEGNLLGVTSKGKEDVELKGCVSKALEGAPFPRSHSGVITVTKTYEELVL